MLAACGLDRLGLAGEIGLRLDPELMLPEAGQGALALQVRAGEEQLARGRGGPRDPPSSRGRARLHCRRRRRLSRSRRRPHDGSVLTGLIAAEDGSWIERLTGDDPAALGRELAARAH